MPTETQIAKWGNSLAVRLPKSIVQAAGFADGDKLSLDLAEDGSVVLRSSAPRYSLDELLSGVTPKNRPSEVDWGVPQGKEEW